LFDAEILRPDAIPDANQCYWWVVTLDLMLSSTTNRHLKEVMSLPFTSALRCQYGVRLNNQRWQTFYFMWYKCSVVVTASWCL